MRTGVAIAFAVLGLAMMATAAGGSTRRPWIVFSASPQHGTQPAQLFRVRSDGSGLKQITTGRNVATDPSISPSGKKIAFARLGSGLFTVTISGAELHRISGRIGDAFPVWSPSGSQIAFLRAYRGELHLYVMNANGSGQHLLPRAPAPAGRPSWTPDAKIVIPANGTVYKVDSATGRVLGRLNLQLEAQNSVAVPTLAPSGRVVAFVGPRPSPPDCQGSACEVFALYVKQLSAKQRKVFDAGPAGWSSDSRTLAFAHDGVLVLQTLKGATTRTISTGTNAIGGDAPPAWQPLPRR